MPVVNWTVPAPLIGPLNAAGVVPLPNCSVAVEATLHDPAHVPLHTPILDANKVPLLSVTVPVLLKVMEVEMPPPVLVVPPVFSNVPALLKTGVAPPSNWIAVSLS